MGLSQLVIAALNSSKWRHFSKKLATYLELNQHCLLCHQSSGYLICHYCEADIISFEHKKYNYNLLNHVEVYLGLRAVNFDSLTAFSSYQWPLSHLITQLKFHNKSIHARGLAQLFCQRALPPKAQLPQAIIPIPLHRARLAQRKYNQAAVIALEVAKSAGIICLSNVLSRPKKTLAQTDLSAHQRQQNIKDAFSINMPLQQPLTHVALFDDVVTTGATINSAAEVLRAEYPDMQIDAWSICITPKNSESE
ncbi:MAG: ComF family protein [Aliiglaciecola sp.]|uniref:ComF family protein n=1 Tax=Aliiglaciecola sp. TaxID=1872441 RepID=UPI0032975927